MNISNSLGSFGEKINSFGMQNMKSSVDNGNFKQFTKALSQNRPIKICFFGDSITAGSDQMTEYSTRTSRTTINGSTGFDANGITEDCSYTYRFMDMLKDSFPNTTFDRYNYAVGGTRLDFWSNTVTYWGITKKWIDFCKDANPDVLVIAFGMNHNHYDNAKIFAYQLKALIDYVNANFTTIPDIVVVTTPRCTDNIGDINYGNFENQASRMMAANATRAIGKEYGAYVCDVGRLSDIKRIGLDFTRPIMKKLSLTNDFYNYLTNVTDKGNGSFKFNTTTGTGVVDILGNYQKDFTLKLTLNFATLPSNSNNMFIICFNKVSATSFYDNRVIVIPKNESGVASILGLTRVADYTNWGNNGMASSYTEAESYENKSVTLTISKRHDKLEVRKVGEGDFDYICLQDYVDCWDVPGSFELRYEPTDGNSITVSDIEICGAEYPEYMPRLTENEMFGTYTSDVTTTKLPYGGSGANHPSSIGIAEVYEPVFNELVKDIVNTVRINNRNSLLSLFPVTETIDSNITTDSTKSYISVNTKILSARLVKADGTVFTFNKNITAWAGYTVGGILGVNEFGMFMNDDTTARIIINSPATTDWKITTYQ